MNKQRLKIMLKAYFVKYIKKCKNQLKLYKNRKFLMSEVIEILKIIVSLIFVL